VYGSKSATANPHTFFAPSIRSRRTRSKKARAIDHPPTGDQGHQCFHDSPANRKPECSEAEDREQNPERFRLSAQSQFTSLADSLSSRLYRVLAPAFFVAAQRFFIRADIFSRIAGLMGRCTLLAGRAAFVGAGRPILLFAQDSFIAAPIRFRAAGLIGRLPDAAWDDCDLNGRPRPGRDPSRAAMACSTRLRWAASSAIIWAISMWESVAA
jgi:hypothetical protein